MRLLQILFDGLGSFLAGMLGISSTVILFGILAIFRAISGGLGGSLQVWALPRRIVPRRSWIIATAIGMAIAFLVTQCLWVITQVSAPPGMPGLMLPPISVIPSFILEGIMGVILGIFQWFVLKKNVPKASLWIAINGLGMVVASVVISLLQQTLGTNGLYVSPDATNPIFWAIAIVGTIFYAALTGSFFFWSLHQRTDNSG
ncbi:hypothetical protein IQ225_14420 [Synechocystis salina LEGE 06155]|nr:hypothetical protein [Synechocystis salina LEGE 06155]